MTDTTQSLIDNAITVLAPLDKWAYQCHAASLKLVRSGFLGESRVARGACYGVAGQHSWVILGDNCYDEDAIIVDPTLWSYDDTVEGIWVGSYKDLKHIPQGKGSIWDQGRPHPATGPVMELTPREPWSSHARAFLELLGPLDENGWIRLAHFNVEGWPAGEIIDAMCESGLRAYVPIDIVGMNTDRNPNGLYLADGGA